VHIVDVALAPMAGLTSQPSMNALIAALHGTSHDTGMRNKAAAAAVRLLGGRSASSMRPSSAG
jgi:pyruvate carboxylase